MVSEGHPGVRYQFPRNINTPSAIHLLSVELIQSSKMNIFVLLFLVTICAAAPYNSNTCGGVSPVTRWTRTERDDTIRMVIDTSNCRFENTPLYFSSIVGGVGHYLLTGINAIYDASNSGYTINVRSIDGATSDTLMARSAQWQVQWIGVQP